MLGKFTSFRKKHLFDIFFSTPLLFGYLLFVPSLPPSGRKRVQDRSLFNNLIPYFCPSICSDLADWLGVEEIGLFNFKPSVRPVPLEVHIQASGSGVKHKIMTSHLRLV